MAQPVNFRPDAIMTNVSVQYKNGSYIADLVFPELPPAMNKSDKFYTYPKGAWFRDEAGVRGPGARAPRGGYVISTDSYYTEVVAFAKEIPDEDRLNDIAPLQPDIDATEFATDKVALRKEIKVAKMVMTAANWTTTKDVAGAWKAGTGNTFLADVAAGVETVRGLIGRKPNRLLMDSKTFKDITLEATVKDLIKYTGTVGSPSIVTEAMIAAIFRLDMVVIGEAIYSNADEKADGTDFNAVDIWETNATKGSAFLYYAPPRPGRKVPSAGYIFRWAGNGQNGRSVIRWREDAEHQDVVEASEAFDAKVIGADCGYLFTDTILT